MSDFLNILTAACLKIEQALQEDSQSTIASETSEQEFDEIQPEDNTPPLPDCPPPDS